MATTPRVLLVAGALLASASLAQAGNRDAFAVGPSDERVDLRPIEHPVAEVAPAAPQVAATTAAEKGKTKRRGTRLARRSAKAVAVAALKATFPAASAETTTPAANPSAAASAVATTSTRPSTEPPAAASGASAEPSPKATEAAAATPPATPTPGGPREAASGTVTELLQKHARLNGVPLKLAQAVVTIESRGNVRASHAGALGLMQIKYGTARAAGFSGPAVGLFAADTNLHFGMKILGEAYRAAGGDTCGALMRYQSGHYATHMSSANRAYCSKARSLMAGA